MNDFISKAAGLLAKAAAKAARLLGKASGLLKNKQFVRYLITGGSAFLLEYLFYLLMVNVFKIRYDISSVIVFTTMFVLTFLATKLWTFESKDRTVQQFLMHGALFLFNLIFASYYLVRLFVDLGVSVYMAPVLKMAVVVIWNFLIFKFIIYRNK